MLPLFFGSAALFIFKINLNEKPSKNSKRNLTEEIKEGLKILNEKPSLKGAIFNLVVLYSLLAALYVLAISLASEIPLLGPRKFGLLLAMCGVGISIGALFLAQKGHFLELKKLSAFGLGILSSLIVLSYFISSFTRVSILIGTSMLMTGIALLNAFRSEEFLYILLFIFFAGAGTGGVYLLTISFLQATTQNELRGRVFGNFYSIGRVALLISFLTSGPFQNVPSSSLN